MIKEFSEFIDESYLDSNHGPLYHYTTTYQEIILTDIIDIDKYILSVNFRNNSIFDNPVAKILPILKNKNIKIYVDGKEY